MTFTDLLRVAPGSTPDLDGIDAAATPGFDGDREGAKAAAKDRVGELADVLAEFQERLWAEAKESMLIVLQALDAGGKDGLIRNVVTAFNPQGTHVTAFGVPSEEELRHDYLWRVHAATPGRGRDAGVHALHGRNVTVSDPIPRADHSPRPNVTWSDIRPAEPS